VVTALSSRVLCLLFSVPLFAPFFGKWFCAYLTASFFLFFGFFPPSPPVVSYPSHFLLLVILMVVNPTPFPSPPPFSPRHLSPFLLAVAGKVSIFSQSQFPEKSPPFIRVSVSPVFFRFCSVFCHPLFNLSGAFRLLIRHGLDKAPPDLRVFLPFFVGA